MQQSVSLPGPGVATRASSTGQRARKDVSALSSTSTLFSARKTECFFPSAAKAELPEYRDVPRYPGKRTRERLSVDHPVQSASVSCCHRHRKMKGGMTSSSHSVSASGGAASSAARGAPLARGQRLVSSGVPYRTRFPAQTRGETPSCSSQGSVSVPPVERCTTGTPRSSPNVYVYPCVCLSPCRKRGFLESLCLFLLLLSKFSSLLFPQSPLLPRSRTRPDPAFRSASEASRPSRRVHSLLASPLASEPLQFFAPLFAAAQPFSVLEEEGEWVEDEYEEEEDPPEDGGEEDGEADDTASATHRVYQHDERYYRALPLTDSDYVLESIRMQFPQFALSPSVWTDIEEEVSRRLRLVDRRAFPQSFFESITESEALEPGALLTPLGRNELSEGDARAYEVTKMTEIIEDVVRRHLGTPTASLRDSSGSASSVSNAPSRQRTRASSSESASSASAVSPLSGGKSSSPLASGSSQPSELHTADPAPSTASPPRPTPDGGSQPGGAASLSAGDSSPEATAFSSRDSTSGQSVRSERREEAGPLLAESQANVSPDSAAPLGQDRHLPQADSVHSNSRASSSEDSLPSKASSSASLHASGEAKGKQAGSASPRGPGAQSRGEFGPEETLTVGPIEFRPSAYVDLILRVAKPGKFGKDPLSNQRRSQLHSRGPGTRDSAEIEKARSRSASPPETFSPSSPLHAKAAPRSVQNFGEFFLLLRGVLEYRREGMRRQTPLTQEPLFPLGENVSFGFAGDGEETAESAEETAAVLQALRTELDNLSVQVVKKLQAEAYGACAFLSFFGVPDAEGKLQLPGGWPRDIALALRCAVEGNRGRQLCGTCFVIDGLATALGFPPILAGSHAWAVTQDVGIKSLFVLHRQSNLYIPPDLLEAGPSPWRTDTPLWKNGEGISQRSRGVRSSFDAPLIKYEMAAQMGDALGKLAAAYYLRTGLGNVDYRYREKEEIDEPRIPNELLPFRPRKLIKAQMSTERLPGDSAVGCFAAVKHTLDVGSEAADKNALPVEPRFLLREHLVPAAFRHTNATLASLSSIEVASADESHAGSSRRQASVGSSTASEEYALLVQSMARDGSPGGLAALGDLYFHGHEAGGIARDVDRAAELWRSAAAMGDTNAAMALAYLLLGDVGEAMKTAKEDASEKSEEKEETSASSAASASLGTQPERTANPLGDSARVADSTADSSGGDSASSVFSFLGGGTDLRATGPPQEAVDTAGPSPLPGEAGGATGAPGHDVWGSAGDTFGGGGGRLGGFFDGWFKRLFAFDDQDEQQEKRGIAEKTQKRATPESPRAAAEPYLRQVIAGGDGGSAHLARYLAYRLGVEGYTNSTLAGESLQKAADLGDSNAQMLYANAHMSGVRPSSISAHPSSFFPNGTDVSVALRYYKKAAEQGRVEAIFNVAVLTLQGADEGSPSTPAASSTSLDPSSSFSPSSSSSSSSSSPSSSAPQTLRKGQSLRQRCEKAFALLQKVAFSHPTVSALHALSSYAFSKGDETGALLVNLLLSEIGHSVGHVNAAGLWPRLTRRRAEFVRRLSAALKEKSNNNGEEKDAQQAPARAHEREERERGRREAEAPTEERPEGQRCANVSAFAVPRDFLLPQQAYLETPETAVYAISDSRFSVSSASAAAISPFAPKKTEAGREPPAEAGTVSENCDVSVASNAMSVHLRHLRVSEFLRCWARPPGDEWLKGLHLRFPFLRRLAQSSGPAEGEGEWGRLSNSESEGRACAFYFLRRAAAGGDATSMLEVTRAYLEQAAFFEDMQEQVHASFASRSAVFRSLSVEERIEEIARRTVEEETGAAALGSEASEGSQAVPHSEGAAGGRRRDEKGDSEGGRPFAVPAWVTRLFFDAIEARKRASFLWRSAAAKQKDGRGLLELGEALEYGQGVRRNRKEAYKIYWAMATDPQHAAASRFLGFLALTRALLNWAGRRIIDLSVPSVSDPAASVSAVAAPQTGHEIEEKREREIETVWERGREDGDVKDGDALKELAVGKDDDPSPIACIQEFRASEQRAHESQNYVWNRLLLVFCLLLLASLLGILTAVHARGLTAAGPPLRAAERETNDLPFFNVDSFRERRPTAVDSTGTGGSAAAGATVTERRGEREGEGSPLDFWPKPRDSETPARSSSPTTSAVSLADARMQSGEEEPARQRTCEDTGVTATGPGILPERNGEEVESRRAGDRWVRRHRPTAKTRLPAMRGQELRSLLQLDHRVRMHSGHNEETTSPEILFSRGQASYGKNSALSWEW
ncbi:Sel1 repeat-containing protein [Toxoplasma gondii VEG]|uniref:Sel1 repeat-containing protein n=1 Tax=Toxoplasma gondii (strain ATCC 50861 / VEG) TaxID=432359 RepID=V4ZRF1_TOXGV|nr:Sel1 repeat-containing protein [Toxoplasma gondii VEG]